MGCLLDCFQAAVDGAGYFANPHGFIGFGQKVQDGKGFVNCRNPFKPGLYRLTRIMQWFSIENIESLYKLSVDYCQEKNRSTRDGHSEGQLSSIRLQ
jgi:hypothetical protein